MLEKSTIVGCSVLKCSYVFVCLFVFLLFLLFSPFFFPYISVLLPGYVFTVLKLVSLATLAKFAFVLSQIF